LGGPAFILVKGGHMKKRIFVLTFSIAIFLIIGVSTADDYGNSGSTYDWQSGNTYNYYTDSFGDTHVRGYNYNTGSQWNTTIESDGDMKGYDSNYNYWNYDSSSGVYYNYGTGEMRVHGEKY
jgi:hypothetical protein